MLNQKNAKAYAVMAILVDMLPENHKMMEEPYLNGRECGFAFYNWQKNKKAVWSEHRTSDSIIVYTGTGVDFSQQGNVPCEKVYREGHLFDYDQYLKAAQFIMKHLEVLEISSSK